MFDWIYAVVGGLIAGVIAKALVKGEEPGGVVFAAVVGILGGVLGKIILGLLHIRNSGGPIWNLGVAVLGAVILVMLYHATVGKKKPAG
jgi:uncharacterized membrane protein YeaQ/YmgE (transglycosylase-associated protein family)